MQGVVRVEASTSFAREKYWLCIMGQRHLGVLGQKDVPAHPPLATCNVVDCNVVRQSFCRMSVLTHAARGKQAFLSLWVSSRGGGGRGYLSGGF